MLSPAPPVNPSERCHRGTKSGLHPPPRSVSMLPPPPTRQRLGEAPIVPVGYFAHGHGNHSPHTASVSVGTLDPRLCHLWSVVHTPDPCHCLSFACGREGESHGFFPSLARHSSRHHCSCAALTIASISGARGMGYSLAAAIDLGMPCGLWQLALAAARPRREGWRWRRRLGFGCAPEPPIRERHGAGLPLWTL